MKIRYFSLALFVFFSSTINLFSEEINFKAKNMNIEDNGNTIIAYSSEVYIPKNNINIKSNIAKQFKKENLLIFKDNVLVEDEINKINIESENIRYEKNNDIFFSLGDTIFKIGNDYVVYTSDVYFDRSKLKMYGNKSTKVTDNNNNVYKLIDGFVFDINKELIKSKKSTITDNKDNIYKFENLVVNLKTKEIAGNELKVEFNKNYFGNENNDPILKGRSSFSNDNELKVYKAVFSTCNTNKKKCRGWELSTDEFTHNKTRKIFEYRNSWLKIFDFKLFFLPYFNHPDPTVKRKSGFLTPSYATSDTLGTSINFPYFKILGEDKDITFSPRYYADKSFLLQNEYRQAFENANILSDFSFLIGKAGTKGHLFYKQSGKINNITDFELNFQNVKGDNYLKTHNLIETSELIKNDSLLISNFDLNFNFDNASLDTSFKIFEDLSRDTKDRYQYIFPDFNFTRNIDLPDNYNGNFNFNSYGYNKLYDTNVKESVITNDFLFRSNDFISQSGIVTDYNLLLKNSNNYSDNSTLFNEKLNYDLFGLVKVDTSFPLEKRLREFTHYLKPLISLRYSPNGNNDLSSKDVYLNYNSVFNLNRIGSTSQVEGGESLSLGLEFKRLNNLSSDVLDLKVANVIKPNEDYRMPTKSKLNKKRSDIFGNLNYRMNNNTTINYIFSYDKDLKYSNLDQIGIDFSVNNFLTNISYYSEQNDLPDAENVKNYSEYSINDENKLKFEISKDLNDNFTEYYDLIYSHETDCIALSLNFNKSFYRDGKLEPSKNLSFLIKIIPFTDLVVPNVGSLVSN